MPTNIIFRSAFLLTLSISAIASTAQQDGKPLVLEVSGRVTDGHKKLAGCTVVVYEGNEVLGQQVTGKNGYFGFAMTVGKQYAVLFSSKGFQSKSILIDTQAKLPPEMNAVPPLDMDLSLQALSKYEGVDTDVLDFPYAIVKWDKRAMAFVQDVQYTTGMMRTTGALLLQSGRGVKQ
jgi:hypothetical protein